MVYQWEAVENFHNKSKKALNPSFDQVLCAQYNDVIKMICTRYVTVICNGKPLYSGQTWRDFGCRMVQVLFFSSKCDNWKETNCSYCVMVRISLNGSDIDTL